MKPQLQFDLNYFREQVLNSLRADGVNVKEINGHYYVKEVKDGKILIRVFSTTGLLFSWYWRTKKRTLLDQFGPRHQLGGLPA